MGPGIPTGQMNRHDAIINYQGGSRVKKWSKITLITVPVVMAGSVYAFAEGGFTSSTDSNRSSIQTVPQSTSPSQSSIGKDSSGVTISIDEVKPAPVTNPTATADANASVPSTGTIPNPFVVENGNQTSASPNGTLTENQGVGARTANPSSFSIENVQELHLNSNTNEGELKLDYRSDDKGAVQLTGTLGQKRVEVKGSDAKQLMSQLIERLGLLDGLNKAFTQPGTPIDRGALTAVHELNIVMKDGEKVKFDKEKVNVSDHGLHKGWEKQKEHMEHGKHKGKDKDDD
jgi:hypothetical protein